MALVSSDADFTLNGKFSRRFKAGTNTHATAPVLTVPSGKVWCVTNVSMTTTAAANNQIYVVSGGINIELSQLSLAERTLETVFSWSGMLWLEAGDTVNGAGNTASNLKVLYVEYDM